MVGDIGGELMRQGGRMDRVKEQIVLIERTQIPGRGTGEIAGPAHVGYICEGDAVLGGEVGRFAGDQIEVSIGGQVVNLEAQVFERDEVGEHRLIKRLRKTAGEILPGRSFGAEMGGQPQIRYLVEQEVARAERKQRLDGVDRVGLGLGDGRAGNAGADLARVELVERLKDVVAADVERVKRAPDRRRMPDGVLRDLEEQVTRIYAFNGGRAGLRPTEGEVIAAREARL